MADLKITQLPEETSPVGADLIAIVDDVAGTPTTKKATLTNIATLMGTLSGWNHTYTSAHASPPASPSAGDLWLPNDSFYAYRYSGSVWVPWGPIFPMTPPVDGDFAWINQGSATVTTTNGGIHLFGPRGATNNLRIRKKAAPSTPYTITAAFLFKSLGTLGSNLNQLAGLAFRQSSDGKLHTCSLVSVFGFATVAVRSTKWTNETTFSADYTAPGLTPSLIYYLRIADNGTSRICSVSADGINFDVFHTVGRTDFLTADEVGFVVNDLSNTYDVRTTLLSWKET